MDYIEFTAKISPLEMGRDILTAELANVGFESFVDTEEGIQAYIQKAEFKIDAIERMNILKNDDFIIKYFIKTIKEQNWNAEWEKNFEPINVIDKCYIRAPFHKPIPSIQYDIVIEPKMSFGTGHHETTYLMVKRALDIDFSGKKVLDMGCGTGILAILAKLKNAKHVIAIDIDDWAYNNAIENINYNEIKAEVKLGGAEDIEGNDFDLIFANINRNILLKDMNAYCAALKKGGSILLSGFFKSDVDILLLETKKYGLDIVYTSNKNDWTMLHLIKTKKNDKV